MAISRSEVMVELPRPLTSLIGREQELNHLYELLRSDAALVTITGFGGIGKTRLSLQAALELEPQFEAGAIFVTLASVTQGSTIARAIARTANLDDSVDTAESLADALGPLPRLLVLDNLEQIPDAADAVLQLLQTIPNVTILATSRTRLDITGEYLVPLDPLETQSDTPRSLPAVQLFIERAKSVAPTFPVDDESIATIAGICQKLDGIPLAIELAAARLSIFSLDNLRDQLDNILPVLASNRVDMPDRQRTMRNAIAWTYNLLDSSQRRLFTWLSVYEQDFSLESVKHVARALELTEDPIDLVQFLVNRSLVRPSRRESGSPRFQMLQMLREFGHEQLLATNERLLARRSHARDMVALAERVEPSLVSNDLRMATQQLNDDLPNIYAALAWSRNENVPELGQRIFASIWRYFENTGQVTRALEFEPDTGDGTADDATRARALVGIGYLYERNRHLRQSLDAFTKARELAEHLPDQVVHVRALTGLGTIQYDYSDIPLAQTFLKDAHQLATRIGDARGQMTSSGMLAIIDVQLGKFEEAIAGFRRTLQPAEEMGDFVSVSSLHLNTALCYQSLERYEEAQGSFLRSLAMSEEIGDLNATSLCYANLAGNSLYLNRLNDAREYAEKGLEIAREIGQKNTEATLLTNLAGVHHRNGDLGSSATLVAQASLLLDFEGGAKEQIHFASVLSGFCMELDLHIEAAELLGAVLAMRENLQIINRDSRGDAEDRELEQLDPENNPVHAAAMERGAAFNQSELVERIQQVRDRIVALRPAGSAILASPQRPQDWSLTPRETEVLGMLAKGLTNAEIAEEMFVSTRTITTHLSNIFGKMEVNNRSHAVSLAMQHGLV